MTHRMPNVVFSPFWLSALWRHLPLTGAIIRNNLYSIPLLTHLFDKSYKFAPYPQSADQL